MTTRTLFERFAKRRKLSLARIQEVTRNGPRWEYSTLLTETAWQAWQAATRAKIRNKGA
jgi:hypothetical protein